jgi:hypothetical protein
MAIEDIVANAPAIGMHLGAGIAAVGAGGFLGGIYGANKDSGFGVTGAVLQIINTGGYAIAGAVAGISAYAGVELAYYFLR